MLIMHDFAKQGPSWERMLPKYRQYIFEMVYTYLHKDPPIVWQPSPRKVNKQENMLQRPVGTYWQGAVKQILERDPPYVPPQYVCTGNNLISNFGLTKKKKKKKPD